MKFCHCKLSFSSKKIASRQLLSTSPGYSQIPFLFPCKLLVSFFRTFEHPHQNEDKPQDKHVHDHDKGHSKDATAKKPYSFVGLIYPNLIQENCKYIQHLSQCFFQRVGGSVSLSVRPSDRPTDRPTDSRQSVSLLNSRCFAIFSRNIEIHGQSLLLIKALLQW